MSEYDNDEWRVEAGRKGGRESRMSSEQAAANAQIEHGIYSKDSNYFANLPGDEKTAVEFAYFMMESDADISESYEDGVMDKAQLREAVIGLHKARSVESNAEYEKQRTIDEASRHRKYAVGKLRELDVLEDDETSVEQYFPAGPMFPSKVRTKESNEDGISSEQSTSPFDW